MATEPEKTEMLIEQVKSHRMLYDKSHENFKDVGTKNKLWSMIAKNMEESDGIALKNRWKNLRDNYIKYLRSNKPNHGLPQRLVKQYKTWAWAPHMAFIKPYLSYIPRTRIQRDPLQSPSHEGIEEDETIDNTRVHTQQQQTRKRPLDQNAPQVSISTSETPVDKVINYLSKKQKDYDDIDLIFMGYAKTVKKMSKSRQATVKFEIAKIIMESELQENEETSSLMDVKNFQHNQDENGFYFQNV